MSEPQQAPYRLLCMDGGGIYGYFTVLMLKKFAEKYPNFLKDGHITAFAGTSAGALISLLLAKEKNPREYLLSGELDKFFASDLLHGNQLNPIDTVTSLMGLTTWCGGSDMQKLLKNEFGDRTLGDLYHKVLIMTFDLSGKTSKLNMQRKAWKTKVYHNFHSQGNDLEAPAWFVAYGAACPATIRPVIDGISDGGIFGMSPTLSAIAQLIYIAKLKTKIVDGYMNHVDKLYHLEPPKNPMSMVRVILSHVNDQIQVPKSDLIMRLANDRRRKHADIELYREHLRYLHRLLHRLNTSDKLITEEEYVQAEAAFRDDTLNPDDDRAFLEHLRDAQVAELSILEALNKVVNDPLRCDLPYEDDGAVSYDPGEDPVITRLRFEVINAHGCVWREIQQIKDRTHPYLSTLDNIQALSLGVGNFVPSFFKDNFNLGFANFNLFPTNPAQNVWTPPALHLLYSPSTDHTDYETEQFLGQNYFRCSPPVIGFPTPPVVTALYLARFRPFRHYILEGIKAAFNGAGEYLDECEAWLQSVGWVPKA